MLCGGIASYAFGSKVIYLGGIALVDVETMVPLAEVPITGQTALGYPLTANPIDASVEDGKLRLYLLPEQGNATLYVIEAQV